MALADPFPSSPGDAEKADALTRMKRVATGMLLAVTALFVIARAAEDDRTWVGYVAAFAEAAMVGALADWFAVTALFRHPLGMPIPHTAIIPRRKDQIGASLGEFVESNFLSRELIDERLARADVGGRVGAWLRDPEHAARAAAALADGLRGTLDVLDDREIATSVEALAVRRIRAVPVAPLLGRAIDLGLDGGHQEPLLDAVLRGIMGFLDDHRLTLRAQLTKESPWWVPESIDDRIFTKIFDGAHRFLGEIANDREHPVRQGIDDRLVDLARKLRDDPELLARGEALKEELLDHPDVRAWIGSLWGEAKSSLAAAAADPGSELRMRMVNGFAGLGERLGTDAELRAKVDRWIASTVAYVVEHYRGEVSQLISSTVERWDAESTSRRLELQVGRDLQFIRINGTVVGGIAGLLIHTIDHLFL